MSDVNSPFDSINEYQNLMKKIEGRLKQSTKSEMDTCFRVLEQLDPKILEVVIKTMTISLVDKDIDINNPDSTDNIRSVIKFLEYVTLDKQSNVLEDFTKVCDSDHKVYYNFIIGNILAKSTPLYSVLQSIENEFLAVTLPNWPDLNEEGQYLWSYYSTVNREMIANQLKSLEIPKEIFDLSVDVVFAIMCCDKPTIETILTWKYLEFDKVNEIIAKNPIETALLTFLSDEGYLNEELMNSMKETTTNSEYLKKITLI